MTNHAQSLVTSLRLEPHPEGGWFREIHRATTRVNPGDGRGERSAFTIIWFLLAEGERSRWHRVRSDEAWQFVEGDPLTLFQADPHFDSVREYGLGPLESDTTPTHVVPRGAWQAARTTGAYTLVTCTVAPGFEFEDFEMLRDNRSAAAAMAERHPALAAFI